MSEVAFARGYILGFIDTLKIIESNKYHDFYVFWKTIDNIEDERERHHKTIIFYQSLDFGINK